MIARLNYSVEFNLQNPVELQDGPVISIAMSGITCAQTRAESSPRGSLMQPLSIAGFWGSNSIMTQATPAQNGTNEIRVALTPFLTHPVAPRVELLSGGEQYISVRPRVFAA